MVEALDGYGGDDCAGGGWGLLGHHKNGHKLERVEMHDGLGVLSSDGEFHHGVSLLYVVYDRQCFIYC